MNITTLSASFPPSLGSSRYLLLNAAKWLCIIYNLSSESHRSFPSPYCPFHLLFSILFAESQGGVASEGGQKGVKEERRRGVAVQGEIVLIKETAAPSERDPLWCRD